MSHNLRFYPVKCTLRISAMTHNVDSPAVMTHNVDRPAIMTHNVDRLAGMVQMRRMSGTKSGPRSGTKSDPRSETK